MALPNAERAALRAVLPALPADFDGVREARADAGRELALAPDAYWVLVAGEVVAYRGARAVELWRAPHALDLAGTVAGARAARFVAAGRAGARALGVPREALAPDAALAAVARESAALWARVEADAARDDDLFLPGAGARPVPGPWRFGAVRGAALVVQGDAARVRAWLPPGVRSLPRTAGRYVLLLASMAGESPEESGGAPPRPFAYREATVLVPAWVGAGPAAFVPELYPDSWMATILGREIHGFPKRVARVALRDDGGEVLLANALVARARWRAAGARPPGAALAAMAARLWGAGALLPGVGTLAAAALPRALAVSLVMRKRIGAPESAGATSERDALVRVPFRFEAFTSASELEVSEAELSAGPEGVLHGEVLGGWLLETGFSFGQGEVVRAYRGGEGEAS